MSFVYSALGWLAAGGIATAIISSEAKKTKAIRTTKQRETEQRKFMQTLLTGPKAPTPEDAKAKAREAEKKRRRLVDLSGGKTILTTEVAPTGSGVKTLLG